MSSLRENIKLEEELTNEIENCRGAHWICLFFWQDYYYNKIVKLTNKYNTVATSLLCYYYDQLNTTKDDEVAKIREYIDKLHNKKADYEKLHYKCLEFLNVIEL